MTPTAGRARDCLRIVESNPDPIFIIDHVSSIGDTLTAKVLGVCERSSTVVRLRQRRIVV
jgi:hypothetical protein